MYHFHIASFTILKTNAEGPTLLKCSNLKVHFLYCPPEKTSCWCCQPTLEMSLHPLQRDAMSKWQTLLDLWHWKWVRFCLWTVCHQRTKVYKHSYLPKAIVQWKAEVEFIFSTLQSKQVQFEFPVLFFSWNSEKPYWASWKNRLSFLCPGKSRQPQHLLVKAVLSLVVVSCQNFLWKMYFI